MRTGQLADATVFTDLFYRDQIAQYYRDSGLPEPYDATARRKIMPETLEQRVLAAFAGSACAELPTGYPRPARCTRSGLT